MTPAYGYITIDAMIVFAVSGWSGAGKTRLITELIKVFCTRGLRVLAAKHSGHNAALEPDAKDSRTFLEAGADSAAVLSGNELMQIRRGADSAAAAQFLRDQWAAYDVVLLEGRAFRDVPFLEVLSGEDSEIRAPRERLIAVVTDHEVDFFQPRFGWNEMERLAAFLEEYNGI